MARTVSSECRIDLSKPNTPTVFLVLLTITHDDMPAPGRICNNNLPITSRGNVFLPCPFQAYLPSDKEDEVSRSRISIDNIHRDLIPTLRSVSSSPLVTIEVIRASAPDVVEQSFEEFTVRGIKYDAHKIDIELSMEDFMLEPIPGDDFTPGKFPGLFSD
jgi:hypothetical protein